MEIIWMKLLLLRAKVTCVNFYIYNNKVRKHTAAIIGEKRNKKTGLTITLQHDSFMK